MLRAVVEPLGEVCSVTGRLSQRELGLQTSRRVNIFFPAKGRILFEQPSYCFMTLLMSLEDFLYFSEEKWEM